MKPIHVLVLHADDNNRPLATDQFFKNLTDDLRLAGIDDSIKIEHHGATELHDVGRLILRYNPDILHISAHGDRKWLTLLQDIPHEVLVRSIVSNRTCNLCGVVLDSCFSATAISELAESLNGFAIGWSGEVRTWRSKNFATTFYELLAKRHSVKSAFSEAHAACLNSQPRHEKTSSRLRGFFTKRATEPVMPILASAKDFAVEQPLLPLRSSFTPPKQDGSYVKRREQSEIIGLFAQRKSITGATACTLNLHGFSGAGKTEMARGLAAELKKDDTAVLEWNLAGSSMNPMSAWQVMQEIVSKVAPEFTITAIDLRKAVEAAIKRNNNIEWTTNEAAITLRQAYLNGLQSNAILLLLDDARDAKHVRPLLPEKGECTSIVTSRARIADIELHKEIGVMTYADARKLACGIVGKSQRSDQDRREFEERVDEFLRLCDRRALAIFHMSCSIAASDFPISEHLRRLHSHREDYLSRSLHDMSGPQSVFMAISSHCEVLRSRKQFEWWCMLAICDGDFDAKTAAAIGDVDEQVAVGTLNEWHYREHLIRKQKERWSFHDAERDFAVGELKNASSNLSSVARQRFVRHFLAFTKEAGPHLRRPTAVEWLPRISSEFKNIQSAIRYAIEDGEPDTALEIAIAIARYHYQSGTLAQGMTMLEIPATAQLDPTLVAFAKAWRGDLARKSHWFSEAMELFRAVLNLVNVPNYPKAMSHLGLAVMTMENESNDCVVKNHAWEAFALFDKSETGEPFPDYGGKANCLNVIGELERKAGDFLKAETTHNKATGLWRHWGDEWGVATSKLFTARLEISRERLSAAHGLLVEAKRTFASLSDPVGQTYCELGFATIEGCKTPEQAHLIHNTARVAALQSLANCGLTLAPFWDIPWK